MPSFRSPNAQATHLLAGASGIGVAKPVGGTPLVHSLGTMRILRTSLGIFGTWFLRRRIGTDLRDVTPEIAREWLSERSACVGQKTLDNDRQALVKAYAIDVPRIVSTHTGSRQLAKLSRAYSSAQLTLVSGHQAARNRFSTRLAAAAGLRGQELHTLAPAAERPATSGREWSDDRFLGLTGVRYTVIGKGGLIREVMVPVDLAAELERRRREAPVTVRDRKINYTSLYDIAGGNAWAKSFSDASKRALTYSHGAHGLRHSYAQRRMAQLQQAGKTYEQALSTVSQELGHFRPEITEIYLR